jgi:hypothetical protein
MLGRRFGVFCWKSVTARTTVPLRYCSYSTAVESQPNSDSLKSFSTGANSDHELRIFAFNTEHSNEGTFNIVL